MKKLVVLAAVLTWSGGPALMSEPGISDAQKLVTSSAGAKGS